NTREMIKVSGSVKSKPAIFFMYYIYERSVSFNILQNYALFLFSTAKLFWLFNIGPKDLSLLA
ncbi:MAG: hypothetical protein ACXWB4_06290, partial [Kaistella sp.]